MLWALRLRVMLPFAVSSKLLGRAPLQCSQPGQDPYLSAALARKYIADRLFLRCMGLHKPNYKLLSIIDYFCMVAQ